MAELPFDMLVHGQLCVLLALTWLACIAWHSIENRGIKQDLTERKLPPGVIQKIMSVCWARSIQLWIVVTATIAFIIVYQYQLTHKDRLLNTTQKALSTQTQLLAKTQTTLQELHQTASSKTAEIAVSQASEDVAAMFNTQGDPSTNNVLNTMKQRYEELFINYYFMLRCNNASKTDYHILTSALMREMASVNAPSRLQHDIMTAAKGSYTELYAESPCSGTQTEALATQYRAYVNALAEQGGE